MTRTMMALLLGAALLAATPLQAFAEGEAGLEQVLAESADTPAEHKALATHYRAKAASAKERAEAHRSMAKHYSGSLKPAVSMKQKQHCAQLATLNDQQAKIYEDLAAGHDEAAAAQ